ncbi:MAG: ATP-dependent helicase [Bacteroidia bacterium]
MDLLNSLNESQQQAAAHISGPLMVIAGAGSGKTRVLTFRIAHLMHNGVDPFNILALTFTNKAAAEMKERIEHLVGKEARNLWMGTFHSVFAKILRIECERIGYPRDFTIYDTQDSKNLIKSIVKEMNLDDKLYKPNVVYSRISSAKNNLISASAYLKNNDVMAEDRMNARPKLGEIYMEYQKRCFKSQAMDFDDLLFKTNVLLKDHPDVLLKYQQRFQYILVDEYQDTNFSQYLIVKRLAALNENICVVGDDAQSIYAFRGANIQNILNFKRDYPDYSLYKLEQNYRSTKTIVNAANSIIENNKDQIKKEVWTDNPTGEKINVVRSLTDNEEGKIVANSIFDEKLHHQLNNKDFAILYRTNAQSRAFEEALRKLNIPYRIYGGLSFYQRKEIKDLLAYFRLAANPNDEESLKRIINYPKRGIGDTTVDSMVLAATTHGASLWQVINESDKYALNFNGGTKNRLQQFAQLISGFRALLKEKNAFESASEMASMSGILKELYSDKTPEGVSRYDNIQELLNAIKDFTEKRETENSLSDFLIDVALLTDADQQDEDGNDKVSLMTVHSAKGLEFPIVYIVGMEENLFPSQLSLNTRTELEEERRLFYVALTRAEKKAFLTYSTSRYRWGSLITCEPSRFIEEIPEEFLNLPKERQEASFEDDFSSYKHSSNNHKISKQYTTKKTETPVFEVPKKLKKIDSSSGVSSAQIQNISVGLNVLHEKFGKGKVLSLDGVSPNQKATIFFPEHGQKQILLKFAKLDVVG